MVFLKKLATPFISLWRWIKETAWVQPLLIVGIIFAVIFSIPSITSWVSSWDFGDDTYTWLEKNQLSLEGITDREIKGEAAEFFESFNEAQVEWANGNKNEARQALNKYVGSTNKMFLYFVKENDASANINDASNLLVSSSWQQKVVDEANKLYEDNAQQYVAGEFKYQTIFTDQVIDVDDNDHTYDDNSAYDYLLYSGMFSSFYATLNDAYQDFSYYQNLVRKESDSSTIDAYVTNIENFREVANYDSTIPSLVVIDLTDANSTSNIITNAVFTFDGSNQYERATFLANAWIYNDQFKL